MDDSPMIRLAWYEGMLAGYMCHACPSKRATSSSEALTDLLFIGICCYQQQEGQ